MQKQWKMCRTALLGLSLFFLHSQLSAKCIWESIGTGQEFTFKGLDKIFIFENLNSVQFATELKDILTCSLQNHGKILFIQDLEKQIIGALGESKLFLNVSYFPTENTNINALNISVSTGADTNKNHTHFLATVWNKIYLFENRSELNQDIVKALKDSINLFLLQYFSSNPESKGKAIIYYPEAAANNICQEKLDKTKGRN